MILVNIQGHVIEELVYLNVDLDFMSVSQHWLYVSIHRGNLQIEIL